MIELVWFESLHIIIQSHTFLVQQSLYSTFHISYSTFPTFPLIFLVHLQNNIEAACRILRIDATEGDTKSFRISVEEELKPLGIIKQPVTQFLRLSVSLLFFLSH